MPGLNQEDQAEDPASQKLFEAGLDLRLAACALATWAGVLTGLQTGLHRALAPGALACIAALSLGAIVLVRWALPSDVAGLARTLIAVATLAAGVGYLAAARYAGDALTIATERGDFTSVTLKVTTHPDVPDTPFGSDTRTFKATATGILEDGTWRPARAELWVSLESFNSSLKAVPVPGETLRVSGALATQDWLPPPYAGSLKAATFEQVAPAPPWQVASSHVRAKLREAVTPAGINAPLIRGMAIGDDAGLPKRTKEAMLTSSLTHLTAVSGTHIGVTVAVVVWATRGRPRLQGALALLFLVTIVVLVGPAPSVIRASLMSSLAVWATMRRRPFQSLALLSAVVLGVLLVSPWLSRSLGFALSSAATAGIVLFARPLTTWLTDLLPKEGSARKLLAPFVAAVAVAITAQGATLFILPFANPWLPTWGVVANLLVAPIVPLLTLLSVAIAATCWWAPPLATILVKLATPLANWVAGVALWVSDLPFARLPWPEGAAGAYLAVTLLAAIFVVVRAVRSIAGRRSRSQGALETTLENL